MFVFKKYTINCNYVDILNIMFPEHLVFVFEMLYNKTEVISIRENKYA